MALVKVIQGLLQLSPYAWAKPSASAWAHMLTYKLVRKEEEHSLSAHCPQDLCMTDSLFAKYILNSFVPGKAPVQAEKLPACRQCGAGEDSCRTAMVRGKELIQASVCQGKPKRKMWPCSACPPLSHHAQSLELEAVWMNCRDPRWSAEPWEGFLGGHPSTECAWRKKWRGAFCVACSLAHRWPASALGIFEGTMRCI